MDVSDVYNQLVIDPTENDGTRTRRAVPSDSELKSAIERTYDGPVFSNLDTKCPFMGFVPQWDLLNFLATKAREFPSFQLRMNTKAVNVIREGRKVVGARCRSGDDAFDVHADLKNSTKISRDSRQRQSHWKTSGSGQQRICADHSLLGVSNSKGIETEWHTWCATLAFPITPPALQI